MKEMKQESDAQTIYTASYERKRKNDACVPSIERILLPYKMISK